MIFRKFFVSTFIFWIKNLDKDYIIIWINKEWIQTIVNLNYKWSKPSSQKVDAELLYEETIKTGIAFHWLPQIGVSRFMKRVTNFQPRINETAIG